MLEMLGLGLEPDMLGLGLWGKTGGSLVSRDMVSVSQRVRGHTGGHVRSVPFRCVALRSPVLSSVGAKLWTGSWSLCTQRELG